MPMQKFIRKIRRVSTHSYAVTLPKSLMKKFKWKERQKVVLIFGGRKHEILIKDWEPKK
ncbi:hypothetical protein HQ544_01660 [Candidatus Falkowbacteria bacterium]|nr:hypothetical protein [Candidatus Falkowbacteria bacterium]